MRLRLKRRRFVRRVAPYDPSKPRLVTPPEPTEPATTVVMVAEPLGGVRLTWEEYAGLPRELPAPRALLDEAYETGRLIMDGVPGSVEVSVTADGVLISSGYEKASAGVGVLRLSIIGASRDHARAWAERRLGATGWQRVTGEIEVADLP
jgi:hypothetical protein